MDGYHRIQFEQLVTERRGALAPFGSVIMDINYLLEREQVSLMRAKAASSTEARLVHEKLAKMYGDEMRGVAFPSARTESE